MIRRAVLSALLSSAICYSAWAATPRFIPGTATDLPQLVTKEGKIYKLGKKPYPAGTRAKWIAEGRTLAKTPDGYLPKGQKLKGAADNRSYLPPIGDQGSLGSCVFWAGTYYTKTANMKWKDPSINVNVASNQCSPRFTYNLCNAGADNGGYGHEPFEICMRYGVASLQQLPYTTDYTTLPSQADFLEGLHRRTTNYVWLWDFSPDASQIAELKAWLDAGHVAACGVYAEDTFDAWGPGDAPWVGTTCTIDDINHMVTVCGYGTGYYLVANQWGTSFGSNGYIVVDSDYFENYFSDVMYPLEGTYEPATDYAKLTIKHGTRSDIRELLITANGGTVWSNSPLPKDMPAGDSSGAFVTDSRDNLELAVDLSQVAWGDANVVTARVKDAVSAVNGTVTVFTVKYDGTEYASPVVPVPVAYNAYTSAWVRLYQSTDTNVCFTSAGASVNEGGGSYVVTVYKTQASGDVGGNVVLSGTATEGAGADYTISTTNFTLNGATTSATFTVTINDDADEELAETVILTLNNVTGGIVESPSVFTLTINPSDLTGGSVLISQYIETDSGTTPKGIEIWNASAADLTFDSGANLLNVKVGVNGAAATSVLQVASGTLAAGSVWVIGTSDMSPDITQAFTFNGDDAIVVELGGVVQDMIGLAGSDPGSAWTSNGVSTANQNIQLKLGTTFGDPDGWTDPSERFEYVDVGSVLTGFGEPPGGWTALPPVLAPIGNKSAVWSNNLSFTVSAADAVDGDSIALSASNLPAGAVFATVTNAGTVSNTFVWNNVGPMGVYTTTFWAVDKDGADSETIAITIGDGSGPVEIVFQGFEGTANDTWGMTDVDPALVLNTTGSGDTPANQRVRTGSYSWQPGESEYAAETLELAEIDVSAYSDVVMTLHLSATSTDTNDCGMWPGDTMSFAMALDGGAYPSAADITVTGNNIVADGIEGALWGFGATGVAATTAGVSRVLAPANGGIAADGLATVQIALPPGTASVKLKADVVQEYAGYFWNVDDVSLAGIADGGAANYPPSIAVSPASTTKSVAVSNTLTFAVTGREIPNDAGDAITLRATGLPAGASFPEATGTSVLTNTFSWTPTATGTTVVSFFAGDKDGTNQVDVTIEVYDQQPGGTYYGVFAGLNEYSSSYIGSSSWLSGCVPDAMHMFTNATERGSWRDNPTLQVLTNALGTKAAIRAAISNYAALAVAGDTFLYFHSSHGGNNASDGYTNYTKSVYLCTYDGDYSDTELAADLAGFATGVKVVVMVDACFSGGLFKSATGTRTRLPATGTFDLADRVSQIMATDRADKIARGVKGVDKTITTNEIGWVTAADYWQYSWDGDNGGAFTEAAVEGWTNGACDNATYGNQDGYANFYELWNYAKDIAVGYPGETDPSDGTSYQTDAQAFNTNVLLSAVAGIAGDGPVADQPPRITLNPAGTNKTVVFDNPLSFTVTATDADGLAVALSVSGLPAGATAPDTNGTGAVSTTFNWTPGEAQVGTHTVTFSATDDDGTTVQDVKITVRDGSLAADLFISEYVEGTSNNKYIEIFNGTGSAVDLSNYSLRHYNNGSSTASYSLVLSGTLADSDVYVVENSSEALGVAADLSTASSVMTFNGNDPMALAKDDANIDVVGTIGVNVTNLANVTKVRKSTVSQGTTTYDAAEWDDYPTNTISYLGSHEFGAATPTPPTLNAIGAKSTTIGQDLQFQVTATPTDADAVTLTASNLPAGATFNATNQNGTFQWLAASPTGVYSVSFYATDKDGTDSETISVTVNEASSELLAPVIQAASAVDATQFNANWQASAGATGYVLDVGTNATFSTGGGSSQSVLASNAASMATITTDGWSGYALGGTTYLILTQSTAVVTSPVFSTVGFTNLTVDLRARTYGGVNATSNTITLSISTNNGVDWNVMGTAVPTNSTLNVMPTLTNTANLGYSQTRIRWQTLAAGKGVGAGISNLVVKGWSGGGGAPAYVPGYENRDVASTTTFAVTGLTEGVTYYYRVKAYNASSNSPYSAITSVVTAASSGTPPVLNAIGGQETFVGEDLQFQVTATPTDADAVTLTASNLPAGATFNATNENGTFQWLDAAPTGEYSVVFYATDKDGSDGEAVGIYVYPLPQVATFAKPSGASASATFQSVNGQTYRMEFSTDLLASPVIWSEADSDVGTGGALTLSDTNSADPKRYYRVVVP